MTLSRIAYKGFGTSTNNNATMAVKQTRTAIELPLQRKNR